MRILLVLATLSALAGSASPLTAQDAAAPAHGAETERIARSAMSQLRSPATPFHTLEICPDAEAAALRDTVMMAAASGLTADQIVEDVIARRGEQLRIVPEKRGVGLWAWVLPPLVLVGGALFLLLRLRGMRAARAASDAAPAPALSDDDRARLAAAMAEWERTEGTT